MSSNSKEVYVLEKYKNEWAAFSIKVNTYDFFSKNKKEVLEWIKKVNKKMEEMKK